MEIYVGWRAENVEEIEDYLEEYETELEQGSAVDSKFEKDSEKVTVDGRTVCYTGSGGELHSLLEDRKDLEVSVEEENVIKYPYGVTD